jgi:hypothetical protein
MDTTTSYGTWYNHTRGTRATIRESVAQALGEFATEDEVDAIADDWADEINAELPEDMSLCGSKFYGPALLIRVDIRAIIESVDFWAIVTRHIK